MWQRFGGSPELVGKAIRMGRTWRVVVGVMPIGFGFPESSNRVTLAWIPLVAPAGTALQRSAQMLEIQARLREGASIGVLSRYRLEGKKAAEKRPIAAQRKPEILGRYTITAIPLPFKFRPFVRKYFR